MNGVLLGSALAVALLDQATKTLVRRRLTNGQVLTVAGGAGRFLRVDNPGGGLIPMSCTTATAVWLCAGGAILTMTLTDPGLVGAGAAVGLGLAFGGATGNLVDRIVRGRIVDFVGIGGWRPFNFADLALVLGTVIVPLSLL